MGNESDSNNSGDSSGAGRRVVDAAFITALTLALRRRNVPVTTTDAAACVMIASTREVWERTEIEAALGAILVRNAIAAVTFSDEFGQLFDMRTPTKGERGSTAQSVADERPQDSDKEQRRSQVSSRIDDPSVFLTYVSKILAILKRGWKIWISPWRPLAWVVILVILYILAASRSVLQWCKVSELFGIGTCSFERHNGPGDPSGNVPSRLPVVEAGVVVAFLTLLCLLGWRQYVLWRETRRRKATETGNGNALPPPDEQPDGSIFRIGSLGGVAPPFLPVRMGGEIADMIGYRLGGPDPKRFDAGRTMDAWTRGGDTSTIHMARRHELPTFLMIIDEGSDARAWNSLPDELADMIGARGLPPIILRYASSFHSKRGSVDVLRPEAVAIEVALAAPGWTVTAVFGDADRLGRSDRDLMRRIAENGPLVFLDLRDPALWGPRHAALRSTGADLVPATAIGLHDGLARVFAPHLTFAALVPIDPDQGLSAEAVGMGARDIPFDPLEGLGLSERAWASDCALVEPISFALAETLRQRYDALASPCPSLAFSKLATLPGSWMGPEGLRFDPSTRRLLLNVFSGRDFAERERTMQLIDAAFVAAVSKLAGVSSRAVLTFARSVAQAVALASDEALADILALRDGGLLADGVSSAFLARLRPPSDRVLANADLEAVDTIILADEPQTAAMRQALFGNDGIYSYASPYAGGGDSRTASQSENVTAHVAAARWTLGLPDIRLSLSRQPVEAEAQQSPTVAAFFSGGRYLLAGGVSRDPKRPLELFDTVLGTSRSVSLPPDFGTVVAVVAARDVPIACAVSSGARIAVLQISSTIGGTADTLDPRIKDGLARSAGPVPNGEIQATIDVEGRFLFMVPPKSRTVFRIDIAGDGQATWFFDSPVTALSAADGGILIGLQDGQIRRQRPDSDRAAAPEKSSPHLDGSPTALLEVIPPPTGSDIGQAWGWTFAVCLDGIARLHDGRETIAQFRTAGPGARAALLRGRACVRIAREAPGDDREAASVIPDAGGLSIAVLGSNGLFDIIGVPDEALRGTFTPMSLLDNRILPHASARRAIAISVSTRRAALVEGDRLIIRPLLYDPPREFAPSDLRSEMPSPFLQAEAAE